MMEVRLRQRRIPLRGRALELSGTQSRVWGRKPAGTWALRWEPSQNNLKKLQKNIKVI